MVNSIASGIGQSYAFGGFMTGRGGSGSFEQILIFFLYGGFIGSVARIAIGAYLLFGGARLVNFCIPSNRPYCPQCGYDVREAGNEKCPECGVQLPAEVLENIQRQANDELKAKD